MLSLLVPGVGMGGSSPSSVTGVPCWEAATIDLPGLEAGRIDVPGLEAGFLDVPGMERGAIRLEP